MTKKHTLLLVACLVLATSHAMALDLSRYVKRDYAPQADSLTYVLVEQFMNKSRGIFFSSPKRSTSDTRYIYWQQAHAMDALIYSYERIKNSDQKLALTYATYMRRWYANHANNYERIAGDDTGFANHFIDDMCWIGNTLMRMSEALGDDKFANTARRLYDMHIRPYGKVTDGGLGFPQTTDKTDPRSTCTCAPACRLAAMLYNKYGEEKYKDDALDIYDFFVSTLMHDDGRVEEPPLSYTQGTFGEACRLLYHIMNNDAKYMATAKKVLVYAITSGRCVDRGILRHEGESMDQSIFKAVLIPCLVNYVLDDDAEMAARWQIMSFVQKNADALLAQLDRDAYPKMYVNYYWGAPFDESKDASMGAMTSGVSLIENVARMNRVLKPELTGIVAPTTDGPEKHQGVYAIDGTRVASSAESLHKLPKGIYIVGGKKMVVK